MKTALVVLGIVVAISLATPSGLQVEAVGDSVEFDAFVRNGFVALTGVSSEGASVANGEGCKDKTFTVTCNGKPFSGTECIGKTTVNTTWVKSDDEVFYSIRYCKGQFVNTTWPKMDDNGETKTVQFCKGKTYLYMKDMKKCNETGLWMKKFFYSKSCFSKYFLIVKNWSLIGADNTKVSTYCETASETVKFVEEKKKEGCGSDEEGCAGIPATCNCEATTIDEPCEGRFKIVMDKKPPSNYGRRLAEANHYSEEPMNKKWTFICDGKWTPYNKTLYECEGIKQEYKEKEYSTCQYQSSKNCTGIYGASMFKEMSGGYTMCNGKNSFEELVTCMVVAPPPLPT